MPLLRDESFSLGAIDVALLESQLYDLMQSSKLSSNSAKAVFEELIATDETVDVEGYAESKGYIQESDENAIAAIVDEVITDPASAKAVADIRAGNDRVIGFLVGQIMKKSQGKANPALAQKLIRERL